MPLRHVLMIVLLLAPAAAPGPARASASPPDSLTELRRMYFSSGPTDAAVLALAERLVARRSVAKGARSSDVAEALEWLGRVRLARVEYPAADTAFQRALAWRRSGRRPDAHATAVTLGWLAEAQRVTRQLARAESTARVALGDLARAEARDTTNEIRIRETLGNVLAGRGQGDLACAELARAVELSEALARPDSLQLGRAWRNLGRARVVAGDWAGARAGYEHAAAIQERALGPVHPELATTLYMSSMAASSVGDYVAARRLAERSLAIRERAFGPEHLVVANTSSTLGGALRQLGDLDNAIPLYERAVTILRASPQPNPFELALALNNLGGALVSAGEGARARACLEEARAIREQAFGAGAGRYTWSHTMLAQAMLIAGDVDSAGTEAEQAVASVTPERMANQALDLADAHAARGFVAWAAGRRESALADFDREVALEDSVLGDGSPHTLDALARRAATRASMGMRAGALDDARRIEERSREVLSASARALAEHEALAFERTRASGLDVWLALAADSVGLEPPARAQLADAVVRARLLVLDQLADERRALPHDEPALASAARELEQARDALASAMVDAFRQGRSSDSSVTSARARREATERALAERSELFELGLQRARAGFAEVVAALPQGSALVSYVRHRDPESLLDPVPAERRTGEAATRYSALVFRAGMAAPALVPLGPAVPLETSVARWLEACAAPPPDGVRLARAAERRCDALGGAVRALAWAPLERHLAGASRVFVVPDGALHAMNFLALPDGHGRRLVDHDPTLHRLTAERDLLPWDAAEGLASGLLVMGGVDFDRADHGDAPLLAGGLPADGARAVAADSTRLHFAPLPQTAAEVAEVAALWRSSGAPDAADVLERTGAAASEEAFERDAPGRRVLHLATHGFALGRAPRARAAGTRAVGAVVGGGARAEVASGAPELPGLALAGANAVAPAGAEDGFLTAEEITSMDLVGAEWAVLSACETGLADPAQAEAVQGLQRAFRRAGLRTVVMSLWAVDDASTRAWMRALYTSRLTDRLDTATSVTLACRRVLHDRRAKGLDTHPFRWAAFVAAGDWR